MSTSATSATGATVQLPEDRDAGVPLLRLVQVEMRKMVDTRAGFWLILVIVLLSVAATGLFAVFGSAGDRTFETYIGTAGGIQGFLLPILGILLVTSEWGQRAALTTFTLVPRRPRVLVAKVLAALVIGLGVMVVAVLVAALMTVVRGGPDAWGSTSFVEALGRFGLLQSLGILQGLGFGMLFLNSAAAIVTFFVLPIASTLVFNLVPALKDAGPWLDTGTAQGVLTAPGSPSGQEWAQLLTSSLIWIGLPLLLGALRILRSEVK